MLLCVAAAIRDIHSHGSTDADAHDAKSAPAERKSPPKSKRSAKAASASDGALTAARIRERLQRRIAQMKSRDEEDELEKEFLSGKCKIFYVIFSGC